MSTPIIVVGDRTSHGGLVISGSQVTDIDGKAVARVGDIVSCPRRGHGTNPIVTGDPTLIVDGQPVARHGDQTACGAVLLATQIMTTDDPGACPVPSPHFQASTPIASGEAYDSHGLNDDLHALRFQAIDPQTGQPMSHCVYYLTHKDGTESGGVTDSRGFTAVIEGTAPEVVGVHFAFKSPKGNLLERDELA